MISLRQRLSTIGEPKHTAVRIPGSFAARSSSLREMMRAMTDPRAGEWFIADQGHFENHGWAEECEGVAHDSTTWYLASNREGHQGIFRFSLDNNVTGSIGTAGAGCSHLGDIDVAGGTLHAAMEGPMRVVKIPLPGFNSLSVHELTGENGGAPPNGGFPWCAIHPWNGLLYTSNYGDGEDDSANIADIFAFRYDVGSGKFVHVPAASFKLAWPIRHVQGGAFTKNGRLILATHDPAALHVYCSLNGFYHGAAAIEEHAGFPEYEEVEGLTVWEGISYSGAPTQVHVILLDNDSGLDDIWFKHYQVPDPEGL